MKTQTRWIVAALIAFAADRLLKTLALRGVEAGVANDFVRFELFRNEGIAFSLPFSGPLVWILSVGILVYVGFLAWGDYRTRHYKRAEAYLLFILGACSNLFDRIVYGFTVDYWVFAGFSAINLADAMIVAGAVWLVLKTPRKI